MSIVKCYIPPQLKIELGASSADLRGHHGNADCRNDLFSGKNC